MFRMERELAENYYSCSFRISRRIFSGLQAKFLAEKKLIIADPPPAFTELCLTDNQVHPAIASTLEPLRMP